MIRVAVYVEWIALLLASVMGTLWLFNSHGPYELVILIAGITFFGTELYLRYNLAEERMKL